MLKIPYCFLPEPILEIFYRPFLSIATIIETNIFPNFSLTLKQSRIDLPSKKYISFSIMSNILTSIVVFFLVEMIFTKVETAKINPHVASIGLAIIMFFFLFMQQIAYPTMMIKKRIQDIERNLLPALQNVSVQLKSGIPIFDVSVNVAAADYGEISKEFMGVVKQINGGIHQVEAFERMAIENPSAIFRSTIWQMVNGMKTGAELSDVLKEIMANIAEEELIQIEQYGAVLSPLTMFYMIGAVILPALGINFLIVLTSFMNLDKSTTLFVFWGVYGFIVFFQFMFLNVMKQKRPSMLER